MIYLLIKISIAVPIAIFLGYIISFLDISKRLLILSWIRLLIPAMLVLGVSFYGYKGLFSQLIEYGWTYDELANSVAFQSVLVIWISLILISALISFAKLYHEAQSYKMRMNDNCPSDTCVRSIPWLDIFDDLTESKIFKNSFAFLIVSVFMTLSWTVFAILGL